MIKKYILYTLAYLFLSTSVFSQYTTLVDLEAATTGNRPYGSLFYDGTALYGMTASGGLNDFGTIFKIKPDGTGYVKLFDFAGASNGRNPRGSFISDGTYLYGMTYNGGINDLGTVFKIKPDGTGYVKLLDFAYSINGKWPNGSLYFDGSFLYGMTLNGGTYGNGTVFKIRPNGSGFTKLLDFAGATNGSYPWGSLISDGTFLYGMTRQGGTNDMGTIFKIMPNGTGYAKLLDFAGTSNGRLPFGSLYSDGTFLYGMTWSGGNNDLGTVFKITPNGTNYEKLVDFAGAANGRVPKGHLISDGTFLYGMTYMGGTSNLGTLFKIKPDGSGFEKLMDFSGTTNGGYPHGSLISDGAFLYGMTWSGGTTDDGLVFRYGILAGVEETNSVTEMTLSPNPASDFIILHIPEKILGHTFAIFDNSGRKILEGTLTQKEQKVEIGNLSEGIYLLKINHEIEQIVRIVKN